MIVDHEQQRYELVKLDELTLHPDNPRRGDVPLIAESIDVNGFYGALIRQQSTGYVLVGNHRLLAAREHGGIVALPVLTIDVDDDRARRIMLADNRTGDAATYDEAQLAALLSDLGALDGTGFTDTDLAELVSRQAAGADAEQFAADQAFARYSREQIIDAAFDHYAATRVFPYPTMPLHEQQRQINRLAQLDADALLRSTTAYHVADVYHPQRFNVRIAGMRTPVEAFDDDKRLRHAIELVVDMGNSVTDATLIAQLSIVNGTQAAANFRPAFALSMLRRFAPTGSTVLDTSTGYGGRIVGYAASDCARYVGVDPNVTTCGSNAMMCEQLGIKGVELIAKPAEDIGVDDLPVCDFAFTSPPYFSKEHYADDDTQSWVRYGSGDEWRLGFLVPMLRLQFNALRAGAYSCINIADVKIGARVYPLLDWTVDAARWVGFELIRVERLALPDGKGTGEREATEPVVVLRKPLEKTDI